MKRGKNHCSSLLAPNFLILLHFNLTSGERCAWRHVPVLADSPIILPVCFPGWSIPIFWCNLGVSTIGDLYYWPRLLGVWRFFVCRMCPTWTLVWWMPMCQSGTQLHSFQTGRRIAICVRGILSCMSSSFFRFLEQDGLWRAEESTGTSNTCLYVLWA